MLSLSILYHLYSKKSIGGGRRIANGWHLHDSQWLQTIFQALYHLLIALLPVLFAARQNPSYDGFGGEHLFIPLADFCRQLHTHKVTTELQRQTCTVHPGNV